MLRVLTLATLFPDASRPNFGVFVERQTLGLAAHPHVDLRVVAPVGMLPWPLSMLVRQRTLAALPLRETWKGLDTHRPRFAALPITDGRFNPGAMVRALTPLLRDLRRDFPFDVIDAEFFFPDGPAAIILGRRFGVPVSIKARGADVHYWGRARATRPLVVKAAGKADGLLAVSAAMKADMAGLRIPPTRIRVHHTGVELDRFAPRDRAAAKAAFGVTGPLVVALGALIPRKGHEIVIRAVAGLPDVTLLIAGEGDSRGALEAEIAAHGLENRVRLLGAIPHGDLPVLLAAADVMALASSSEGLANAWVEALACGTPIVITDTGGAADVMTTAAAGRIVAREFGAFRAAIADLLGDPPAQEDTRQAALGFTWETNTATLYDHLSGLVSGRVVRDAR